MEQKRKKRRKQRERREHLTGITLYCKEEMDAFERFLDVMKCPYCDGGRGGSSFPAF